MEFKSLKEIQEALLDGRLTMQELLGFYLKNLDQSAHLNAYVEVFKEEAEQYALQLDQKIKERPSQLGKLFGCVVSIKDLICSKNHRISAGSKVLDGFESQFDATAVEAILKEDAIIIGRTNCDEFGMGSANVNSYFGPVRNAADQNKIAGGSSGGAAVSVQTNTCLIALGTDTGGSVRQPASMCGVIGYKPSYGMISRHGLIAYASSFDQLGILGNNAEDIDQVMQVVSIPDDYDSTMFQSGLYPEQVQKATKSKDYKYRIAYFENAIQKDSLESALSESFQDMIIKLKTNGHKVDAISFPLMDYLVPCYYILTTAEASSNLSRYDGVRYGYRSGFSGSPEDMYVNSRTEGFGKEVRKRIMLGTFVLSEAYYDTYFTKAQKVRQMLKSALKNIFEEYDFIMLPTAPRTAWHILEKPVDPLEIYLSDIYTVLANLTGVPAISLPLGKNDMGMPYGIQFYADSKCDKILLDFVENVSDWHNC